MRPTWYLMEFCIPIANADIIARPSPIYLLDKASQYVGALRVIETKAPRSPAFPSPEIHTYLLSFRKSFCRVVVRLKDEPGAGFNAPQVVRPEAARSMLNVMYMRERQKGCALSCPARADNIRKGGVWRMLRSANSRQAQECRRPRVARSKNQCDTRGVLGRSDARNWTRVGGGIRRRPRRDSVKGRILVRRVRFPFPCSSRCVAQTVAEWLCLVRRVNACDAERQGQSRREWRCLPGSITVTR
jgi:hypothetical protein